jgi:hypothetical protein
MNTLLFILITYGFSNIVVYGSIFNGFREFWKNVNPNFFGTLFSCMVCFPTWAGFFMSLTFFSGILVSGTTWLLHTGQEMMERAFQEE